MEDLTRLRRETDLNYCLLFQLSSGKRAMMEDSGAILCHISSLKDMLDQVNDEIEAHIQITREIESEIVKCSEAESVLVSRESELTKSLYMLRFDINGLMAVAADSRTSVKKLEQEICCLRTMRDDIVTRLHEKREEFCIRCQAFQRDIVNNDNEQILALILEKESLEEEIQRLDKKNYALKNSLSALVDDILQELHTSNSAMDVHIQGQNRENEELMKDIDNLKSTLLSVITSNDGT